MENGGRTMEDENVPKRVFLRKVLYRIDFQFITEQKQEEIYCYIAEKYGEYFSDRGYENVVDVESNKNFNFRPQVVYYLSYPKTEGDGRVIKIGKTFVFLDIDLGITSSNLPYRAWFADIINYLDGMKIFRPTRIGLRKYNTFFMLNKSIKNINNIFKIPFFEDVKESSFMLDNFNNLQVYNSEDYSMNFSRNFSTGLLNNNDINNEMAHQISFDFDLFNEKPEVLSDFCKDAEQGLKDMNDKISNFFKEIISDEVFERVSAGDLLEDYGVIVF